jgi:hypothetical protein
MPVDDKLDRPEPEAFVGWCDLIAMLMGRGYLPGDDERVLVVLRRPGTVSVSDADEHIFRVLRAAVARRDTAPWAFYVATPHGVREPGSRQEPLRVREPLAATDPADWPG